MKKFLTELYLAGSLLLTPLTASAETIVLDAGHDNLYYSGTHNGHYKEVDTNVSFSSRLRKILENDGFHVIETYTSKGYNPDVLDFEMQYRKTKQFRGMDRYYRLLYSRALFFDPHHKTNLDNRKYEVDLFLSIHADENGNQQGFTIYAPYSNNRESLGFAGILRRKLERSGFNGWKDGSIKKAGFIVIEESLGKIPRLLLERGFMSNSRERYNLFENEKWNELMAEAVKEAIKEYFKK